MVKDIYSAVIVLVMGLFLVDGNAQSKESDTMGKKLKVEKWTVLEEYEPDMILSAEDRMDLKKNRIVEAKRRKGILDTMDISDRKRKKLPYYEDVETKDADLNVELKVLNKIAEQQALMVKKYQKSLTEMEESN